MKLRVLDSSGHKLSARVDTVFSWSGLVMAVADSEFSGGVSAII